MICHQMRRRYSKFNIFKQNIAIILKIVTNKRLEERVSIIIIIGWST